MKEVVWVFGNGASGKETFIRYVLDPKSAPFRERYHWKKAKVIACQESLEWIGINSEDPIIARRLEIPGIVAKLADDADVILIKGLDIDLENQLPENLEQLLHDATHTIIYIVTSLPELMGRRSLKEWWDGTETGVEVLRLRAKQLAVLAPLQERMKFIVIDGGKGKDYAETELPT